MTDQHTIVMGATYTVMQPEPDPTCSDTSCALCRADLIFQWPHLVRRKVTVQETGLTYAGHPAVRIAWGPINWHPDVMVTLTPEQVRSLGLLAAPGAPFAITGMVWAITEPEDVPTTVTDPDDFPYGAMMPAEIPFQRTEIIPACCLVSTAKPPVEPEVRRREARLRRLAAKQGLTLRKTRVQAPYPAGSSGPYLLLDADRIRILPWSSWDVRLGRGLSLDGVEAALLRTHDGAKDQVDEQEHTA